MCANVSVEIVDGPYAPSRNPAISVTGYDAATNAGDQTLADVEP